MKAFKNFLDTFIDYICARCSNSNKHHHNGEINKFMITQNKIDDIYYKNYFDDIEHGFVHGLFCCFIAYIIDKENINEELFSSLLLHDFLKCSGYSQESHDKDLIQYYNKLLPETYIHSNPTDKYENKLLITCDRIELRRFENYKEWIDERYHKTYNNLDDNKKQIIDEFYNKLRPVLTKLYKNRNEIFIRHGLENYEHADYKGQFPPKVDFNVKVKNVNTYAIEIDRIPFGYLDIDTHKQKGFCSNHGCDSKWNIVKGFITFSDFVNKGGKMANSNIRDHLYATSDINIKDWIFLHQEPKYSENYGERDKEKDKLQIEKLNDNNIPTIEQDLVFSFFHLVKILQDRLFVLNVSLPL